MQFILQIVEKTAFQIIFYNVGGKNMLELYLIVTLFFIYLITAVLNNKIIVRRIWTFAFILAFLAASFALVLLRITHQDVMMPADTFNWYYVLYIAGSLALVLGLVNAWMYRQALWHLFYQTDDARNKE